MPVEAIIGRKENSGGLVFDRQVHHVVAAVNRGMTYNERMTMRPRFVLCKASTFIVLAALWISDAAYGVNADGAHDLGVDYSFMFLTTLSPDFSAANYTIHNEGDSDVEISIARLPYLIDLTQDTKSRLQLESAIAS